MAVAADRLPRSANVLGLTSGLLLRTAGHFGVLAVLPLFLHAQGYDTGRIGTWGLGSALVAAGAVPVLGAAAYLARSRSTRSSPARTRASSTASTRKGHPAGGTERAAAAGAREAAGTPCRSARRPTG